MNRWSLKESFRCFHPPGSGQLEASPHRIEEYVAKSQGPLSRLENEGDHMHLPKSKDIQRL